MTKLLSSIKRRVERHLKYRQTINELSRLTDRELSDLGIGRGDIMFIAREHI